MLAICTGIQVSHEELIAKLLQSLTHQIIIESQSTNKALQIALQMVCEYVPVDVVIVIF